jgi:hypothetical protein
MGRRPSRVRRPAFILGLVVSAALYAYSLAGIASTGGELRSAVIAQSAERARTVSYQEPTESYSSCPERAERPVKRVRL